MIQIELEKGEKIKKYTYKEITFYITNYARLFNLKGKEFKPQKQKQKNDGWNKCLKIQLNIRRKDLWVRYSIGLARLVYKLFIDKNISNKSRIVFKDGNKFNCRYDNLTIGLENNPKIYKKKLPQKKLDLFNSPNTIPYIKRTLFWYYGSAKITTIGGLSFDDLIQESLIILYKSLYNYKEESKYKRFVFMVVLKYICDRYPLENKYLSYDDNILY